MENNIEKYGYGIFIVSLVITAYLIGVFTITIDKIALKKFIVQCMFIFILGPIYSRMR